MLNAPRKHHNAAWLVLVTALVLHLLPTTQAHEFWIEPTTYQVEDNEPLVARLRVGQNMVGAPQVFLPKRFEQFTITTGEQTRPVQSRMGNDPAINEAAIAKGLHILSYVSTDSTVTYDDPAIFKKFLKAEGIEWVLAAHKKRGLPDKGFSEAYQRFAKSLVKVGEGEGNDHALGLRFELIAETNPYNSNADIPVQLLWEGKPFADAQINVFRRHATQVTLNHLRTDKDGRTVLQYQPGDYLLNAVHMIKPSADTDEIVWKSLWASLTFQIPEE